MLLQGNTHKACWVTALLTDASAQWLGHRKQTIRLCLWASRVTIILHSEEALHNLAFLLLTQRCFLLSVDLHVSCWNVFVSSFESETDGPPRTFSMSFHNLSSQTHNSTVLQQLFIRWCFCKNKQLANYKNIWTDIVSLCKLHRLNEPNNKTIIQFFLPIVQS